MKEAARLAVLCVVAGVILPGLVAGHRAEGQPVDWCPGQSQPWDVKFVGTDFGIINDGDTVVGTVTVSGLLFQTCQVNGPSPGTCTVAPDGLSISFNVVAHGASIADISGTYELPPGAPNCGSVFATITLTEPHAIQVPDDTAYACNGFPCPSPIPAVGGRGLAVMGLLLAGTAVWVLKRR